MNTILGVFLPLCLFAIQDDQRNPRNERDSSYNGRQRDGLLRIRRDLDGTDIKDFLFARILDTLIDQS
ncbi:MAG: hypothetical protein MUP98_20180 [Candidatus Aminicenantes bacterium]|nr:hypothetical protein [Candidatus Aminicenantes bacterium]